MPPSEENNEHTPTDFGQQLSRLDDEDAGKRGLALLTITQKYLGESLSASWLSPELKSNFDWLLAESGSNLRKDHGFAEKRHSDSLSFIRKNIDCVDGFELGNSSSFHEATSRCRLLFVQTGRMRCYLKPGLIFPVWWEKKSAVAHAADRRLPTSLQNLAATVQKTLIEIEHEGRFKDEYRNYELNFWQHQRCRPRWANDKEGVAGTPRVLDQMFQIGDAQSAATTLLASLHIAVRGGKANELCLSTGVGQVTNEIISAIKTVASSLPEKLALVQKYAEQKKGASRVKFLVPEADFDRAEAIVRERDWSRWIDLGSIRGHSAESLLDALQPLRESHQAEPEVGDPIESQRGYFSSLSSQNKRSEFHVGVMQRGTGDMQLLPKLKKQWIRILDSSVTGECDVICVSLVGRSWEFPALDFRLFEPSRHLWLLTSDLDGNVPEGLGFLDLLGSIKRNLETNGQSNCIQISGVDVQKDHRESAVRKLLSDEINKNLTVSKLGNQVIIINGSSGATYLRNILIDLAPVDAFIVVYRGQTDPTTNLPLAGSHDLIVYRKDTGGRLVPLDVGEEGL